MLKTLNFEEQNVNTSVENQIWLSGCVAGLHISDICRKPHVVPVMPRYVYMLKTLITGSTYVSL